MPCVDLELWFKQGENQKEKQNTLSFAQAAPEPQTEAMNMVGMDGRSFPGNLTNWNWREIKICLDKKIDTEQGEICW